MSDVTAAAVSTALRSSGWRVRTSASKGTEVVRVREAEPDRIKVTSGDANTVLAVWRAECMARDLRALGYEVEAEDNKTFFHVTGRKGIS